jgi:signal transduction histidine kinase
MWKQAIFPTAVVAGLWLLVSGETTYFIYWLEQSHQRGLSENIASIRAAGLLQETAWRTQAELLGTRHTPAALRSRLAEIEAEFDRELEKVAESAMTAAERDLVAQLQQHVERYRQLLATLVRADEASSEGEQQLDELSELAGSIATATHELRSINEELFETASAERERTKSLVISVRMTVLLVGPALGLALGWWMSRRLHRSIAKIRITLREAAVEAEQPLGTLRIDAGQGMEAVQEQVEQVAERLRRVTRDLHHARREVLRSERLAAVGELAAGVAHDLRNPLTSVKLLLQHAASQPRGAPFAESKLRLILEEIARMEHTIQSLLDFSRPPALRRVRHDVRETLHRALNLVDGRARQQGVSLATALNNGPLTVDADPEQLHQVFVNLLINAIEAMPGGGQLLVAAESAGGDPPEVQVRLHDTGPGLPDEILDRLFEPFATTKDRGTGLGLAVSRRIVEEHGGSIEGANDPQGGALFCVSLPRAVEWADMTVENGVVAAR